MSYSSNPRLVCRRGRVEEYPDRWMNNRSVYAVSARTRGTDSSISIYRQRHICGLMGQEHQTKVIEIPTFTDTRGTLTVVEWAKHLPFLPQRFYCISGAAPGVRRGGHAHWVESEAIFALSGGVTVWTDDGRTLTEYRLERPHLLLLIPPGVWHELHGFSANTLCAVFASHQYNTEDYCRDYNEFLRRAGGRPAENPVS